SVAFSLRRGRVRDAIRWVAIHPFRDNAPREDRVQDRQVTAHASPAVTLVEHRRLVRGDVTRPDFLEPHVAEVIAEAGTDRSVLSHGARAPALLGRYLGVPDHRAHLEGEGRWPTPAPLLNSDESIPEFGLSCLPRHPISLAADRLHDLL